MGRNEIGERLEWAIRELRGHDIQWFQGKISKKYDPQNRRERPGTSYQTILAYVNGDREPKPSFLKEAAQVLGVREAWLTCGEEPAVQQPEGRDEAVALAVRETFLGSSYLPPTPEEEEIARKFRREAKHTRFRTWGRRKDTPVEVLAEEAVHRLLAACSDDGGYTYAEVLRAAEVVSQLALAPIRALGSQINPVESERIWDAYVQAVLHALLLAIPDPGQGRPLHQVSELVESGRAFPPSVLTNVFEPDAEAEGPRGGNFPDPDQTWTW